MIRRRLYVEVRITWLATLSRRIAVFALPVVLLAIVLHRFGLVEYEVAYVTLAAGLIVELLGILVAIAAFIVIWNEGLRGLGRAIGALVIGLAVLAYPAYEFARGVNLPAISDVTTDPSDPPRFLAVASARPSGANAIAYPGERTARLQFTAYPAVKPLEVDAGPDEIFNAALSMIERRGWRVLDSVTPSPVPVHLVYPQNRLIAPKLRAFVDFVTPRLRDTLESLKLPDGDAPANDTEIP